MASQLAKNSPYSASFTAAALMHGEMNAVLPYLLNEIVGIVHAEENPLVDSDKRFLVHVSLFLCYAYLYFKSYAKLSMEE